MYDLFTLIQVIQKTKKKRHGYWRDRSHVSTEFVELWNKRNDTQEVGLSCCCEYDHDDLLRKKC